MTLNLKKILVYFYINLNFIHSNNIDFENLKCKSYSQLNLEKNDYEFIDINTIPIKEFTIVKFEYGTKYTRRTVFNDKKRGLFLKIWGKDYLQKEDFLFAYSKNYYKDIATLKALIIDIKEKECFGYITFAIEPHANLLILENGKIKNSIFQNLQYQNFINHLYEKIINSNIAYYDLVPNNLLYDGKSYYIVDLEPAMLINKLKIMNNLNAILSYNPEDYVLYIESLIK